MSTTPDALTNSIAGRGLSGVIELPNGATRPFPGAALVVERKVMVDKTKLSAKTVNKGKTVKVSSHFGRADWNKDKNTAYAKVKVTLELRPNALHADGEHCFDGFGTVKTGKGGDVSAKVKVSRSGCFRMLTSPTSTTGGEVSDPVCVKVKK